MFARYRPHPVIAITLSLTVAALLISPRAVGADKGSKDADAKQPGVFNDEEVKTLATAITQAAHSTAKNPKLLKASETIKDGVLSLKLQIEYYGALSKNRYTADSLVEVRLPKQPDNPMEVTRIDF